MEKNEECWKRELKVYRCLILKMLVHVGWYLYARVAKQKMESK